MNAIDILLFLGELGGRFRRDQIEPMLEYFTRMIEDKRFITIYEDKKLFGIITFSICDDFEEFCKNPSWDYQPHYPDCKKVFIEVMSCRKWTKQVRRLLEQKLLNKFPQIEEGIWLRGNRLVRVAVKRRIHESV